MIRSLDTETTGRDARHGALPFYVSTCDEKENQLIWEWPVDPLTRIPDVPKADLIHIQEVIDDSELRILHNPKFDVTMLVELYKKYGLVFHWDWTKTRCTLAAGHMLASNQPKSLDVMSLVYLGINISRFEAAIEDACKAARRLARSKLKTWRIAKHGLPEIPSIKKSSNDDEEKPWKYDMWLPKEIAKHFNYPEEHPWHTALHNYGSTDTAINIPLYLKVEELLKGKDLWEIYLERMKQVEVGYDMEEHGVTLTRNAKNRLCAEFGETSRELGQTMVNIAKGYDNYDLVIPKAGNNGSLTKFAFDVLKLPVEKRSKDTGAPSLDQNVLDIYQSTLPRNSKQALFVRSLASKRKCDTALGYMEGYERFWLPLFPDSSSQRQYPWVPVDVDPETGSGWYILHPSLNPTGTDTLRWSCKNPNEQNISAKDGFNVREIFGPAPGREWWSCDAKNIELRIPAYESDEEGMIELFERPNDPPYYGSNHLLVCHILHSDLFNACKGSAGITDGRLFKEKYEKTLYTDIKSGNFAVQYGAQEESGTADRAYKVPGAQKIIKGRLKNITKLSDSMIAHAEKYGYVETMPDKTVNPRRGYPLLCTRSPWGKIKPTVPLSFHVQGTAMWWMGKAMTRTNTFLKQINTSDKSFQLVMGRYKREIEKLGYFITLQVHDELVFDFPKGYGKEPWRTNLPVIKEIMRLMRMGGDDIGVPTPVSCKYHEVSWRKGFSIPDSALAN